MKKYFVLLFLILVMACESKTNTNQLVFRQNFTLEEKKVLQTADSIIKSAYYTTLITLDTKNQPRARIVEPFLPKKEYVIWMATNPKSRKVNQLKHNTVATLHYFDKTNLAYVSLMGNAFLVNDDATKNEIWKEGWEKFYPNREQDYLLIKFVPNTLELISILGGFTGDKATWKPEQVKLRVATD
jgi:general stress protein 26